MKQHLQPVSLFACAALLCLAVHAGGAQAQDSKGATTTNQGGAGAAAATVHKIEFKKSYSQPIKMKQGDALVLFVKFSRDPGLYDPAFVPGTAKIADGKTGDVLGTIHGVTRLDKDTIQIIRYEAKRAGDAEIPIIDLGGKKVGKIKVTVD